VYSLSVLLSSFCMREMSIALAPPTIGPNPDTQSQRPTLTRLFSAFPCSGFCCKNEDDVLCNQKPTKKSQKQTSSEDSTQPTTHIKLNKSIITHHLTSSANNKKTRHDDTMTRYPFSSHHENHPLVACLHHGVHQIVRVLLPRETI
jgi:hypothetical protein